MVDRVKHNLPLGLPGLVDGLLKTVLSALMSTGLGVGWRVEMGLDSVVSDDCKVWMMDGWEGILIESAVGSREIVWYELDGEV